jgi:hypothetical protein
LVDHTGAAADARGELVVAGVAADDLDVGWHIGASEEVDEPDGRAATT